MALWPGSSDHARGSVPHPPTVMPGHDPEPGVTPVPGLDPGINPGVHSFLQNPVDGRIKPGHDEEGENPKDIQFYTNSFDDKPAKDVTLYRFNARGNHPHPKAWPNNRRPTMAETPRKTARAARGTRAARAHPSERNPPWLTP